MSNLFDTFSFGKDDTRVYFTAEGEFTGEFVHAREEITSWADKEGNSVRVMVYTFVCGDGKTRSLWSGSKRLFGQMKKVNPHPGDVVKINRMGEGMGTQYYVKLLKKGEESEPIRPHEDALPF